MNSSYHLYANSDWLKYAYNANANDIPESASLPYTPHAQTSMNDYVNEGMETGAMGTEHTEALDDLLSLVDTLLATPVPTDLPILPPVTLEPIAFSSNVFPFSAQEITYNASSHVTMGGFFDASALSAVNQGISYHGTYPFLPHSVFAHQSQYEVPPLCVAPTLINDLAPCIPMPNAHWAYPSPSPDTPYMYLQPSPNIQHVYLPSSNEAQHVNTPPLYDAPHVPPPPSHDVQQHAAPSSSRDTIASARADRRKLVAPYLTPSPEPKQPWTRYRMAPRRNIQVAPHPLQGRSRTMKFAPSATATATASAASGSGASSSSSPSSSSSSLSPSSSSSSSLPSSSSSSSSQPAAPIATTAVTSTPTDKVNKWKCPECEHIQHNHRGPDLRRHIDTHWAQEWLCCGVPLYEAEQYKIPPSVLGDRKKVWMFRGQVMVGGCRSTFSRKDAFKRHLNRHLQEKTGKGKKKVKVSEEEDRCWGDLEASYQPGNNVKKN